MGLQVIRILGVSFSGSKTSGSKFEQKKELCF
jgi:hypothetical protein